MTIRQIFEKDYVLRVSDFDRYNHIKPSAILELFQDAAGQHAEEIGVGYESMLANFVLEFLFCKFVVYRGKEDTLN